MVCPNCHSKRIIQVQDQFFCINCGQMIPKPESSVAAGKVAVQANGLPEGVKILSASDDSVADAPEGEAQPEVAVATAITSSPVDSAAAGGTATIVKPRHRILTKADEPESAGEAKADDATEPGGSGAEADAPKSAPKRKRGRPKAGRLDVPIEAAVSVAPEVALPAAPSIAKAETVSAATATAIAPAAAPIRRMSDISPRPTPATGAPAPHPHHQATKPAKSKRKPQRIAHSVKPKTKPIHRVGVAPIHYGAVLGNTLRAHSHKTYLTWGLIAATGFASAMAYAAWLYLAIGPKSLAQHLMHPGVLPILELATLGLLYYIGRSIGQTAITYGIIRHADERPVSLSRQFGVAVNTFGRRLRLDTACGLLNILIVGIIALLVITGGTNWHISEELQFVALFCAFLFLLYLMSALAMARGLANVALTTTTDTLWKSVTLGWHLFSHRFELLGFRFIALAMELLLCLPLAALALVIIIMAPAAAHLLVVLGIAVIALAAGALFGVGTAAWWASLYRRIVLTDRQPDAVQLLASRQPNDARRGSLAMIVMAATLLVCIAVALPWLKFV